MPKGPKDGQPSRCHSASTRQMLTGLINAGRTVRAEIAPGEVVQAKDIPRDALPRYALVRLAWAKDGTAVPLLNHYGQYVRLTEDLARSIGIDISYKTLVRLIEEGFVKAARPAPNTYLVDLASLIEHVRVTMEPGWWTPDRIKRYRRAIG